MNSRTTDITHFAIVFHYDVTTKALETLRNTINYLWRHSENNGKVRDVYLFIHIYSGKKACTEYKINML